MSKHENKFQADLIKDIKKRFEGCIVMKNDSNYIQGIPDLTILYEDRWAALECKDEAKASHQPNQDYYISKMNDMSYASFIYPENKEDVLDEMEQAFGARR
jgi:hypothetical protein